MSYVCDSDDGNAAAMLVTNLDTGDVLGLCGQCFPLWVEATHAALSADEDAPVDVVPTDPDTGDETDEDEASDDCPVCGERVPDSEQLDHWHDRHKDYVPSSTDAL